ncbi:MAG: glucose-1-phosphate cytidylyltransferase [Magnetococcales bacterium]|nr:glucose-1-phosphate cytidylyltransferase [Magnetococcales bacterium]
MKTVILCGGLGTRLSEETHLKPKPMVEIGDRPMLWHILKMYEKFGFNDFTLALGYKGEVIKDFFINYHSRTSEVTVHLASGTVDYANSTAEDWHISMVDTGLNSMTGGRLHRLEPYLRSEGTFMLTYGDGLSSIAIDKLLEFHKSHGKIATVTAVRPTARFGGMVLDGIQVADFKEKPQTGEGWINGGFFVFEPEIFDYINSDSDVLEGAPMEKLVNDGELMAFKHPGFWHCMDTVRDRKNLEEMWQSGKPLWA